MGAVLLSSCLLCTDIEVLVKELKRGIDLRQDGSTLVCVEEEQSLPHVLTLDQVLCSHQVPAHCRLR